MKLSQKESRRLDRMIDDFEKQHGIKSEHKSRRSRNIDRYRSQYHSDLISSEVISSMDRWNASANKTLIEELDVLREYKRECLLELSVKLTNRIEENWKALSKGVSLVTGEVKEQDDRQLMTNLKKMITKRRHVFEESLCDLLMKLHDNPQEYSIFSCSIIQECFGLQSTKIGATGKPVYNRFLEREASRLRFALCNIMAEEVIVRRVGKSSMRIKLSEEIRSAVENNTTVNMVLAKLSEASYEDGKIKYSVFKDLGRELLAVTGCSDRAIHEMRRVCHPDTWACFSAFLENSSRFKKYSPPSPVAQYDELNPPPLEDCDFSLCEEIISE